MTNQRILREYYSLKTDEYIYGYMYADKKWKYGDIIQIKKKDLAIGLGGDCFYYVWGWPGPDFNVYFFEDYGYTWAFSREELNGE